MSDHPKNLPVRIDDLPVSMLDVADVIGFPATLKFMAAYGGQEIRLPKRPTDNHPLVALLGGEDAQKLCHLISGEKIYVPSGTTASRITPEAIANLERQGLTRNEIAEQLGVSSRWIRHVANRRQTRDPRQISMFDDD